MRKLLRRFWRWLKGPLPTPIDCDCQPQEPHEMQCAERRMFSGSRSGRWIGRRYNKDLTNLPRYGGTLEDLRRQEIEAGRRMKEWHDKVIAAAKAQGATVTVTDHGEIFIDYPEGVTPKELPPL